MEFSHDWVKCLAGYIAVSSLIMLMFMSFIYEHIEFLANNIKNYSSTCFIQFTFDYSCYGLFYSHKFNTVKENFYIFISYFQSNFPVFFLHTYSTACDTRPGNTKLDWHSADIILRTIFWQLSDNFIGIINNIWPFFHSFGKLLICIIFTNQYDWIKIRKVYLPIYCLMKLQLHVVYWVESYRYGR